MFSETITCDSEQEVRWLMDNLDHVGLEQLEDQGTGVWIADTEGCDTEELVDRLVEFQTVFKKTDPIVVILAFSGSRPVDDMYGGMGWVIKNGEFQSINLRTETERLSRMTASKQRINRYSVAIPTC